jgi:hypothetical protein
MCKRIKEMCIGAAMVCMYDSYAITAVFYKCAVDKLGISNTACYIGYLIDPSQSIIGLRFI